MSRHEIRFSGFGGQGIITSGYILGKAAALYDGRHVTLIKSYGPESRGGASSAQVIISDEEINYPRITRPQLLVAMSQEAYVKYVDELADGGLLLIDEDLVEPNHPRDDIRTCAIPATRIAESELGRKIVANIVMLGFLAANSKVVSVEGIREAVLSTIPKGTEELNIQALERGYTHETEQSPEIAEMPATVGEMPRDT
jgi:2-oxoglutarate ferredoxin oxidoreductase subunit gamma